MTHSRPAAYAPCRMDVPPPFRPCSEQVPSVLTFPSERAYLPFPPRPEGKGRPMPRRCRAETVVAMSGADGEEWGRQTPLRWECLGRNRGDRCRFAADVRGGIGETDVVLLRMFGEESGRQMSFCCGCSGRNRGDRCRFAADVRGGMGETDVASLRMFGEEWGRQMPLRCGRSGRNGGDRCRFAADGRGEGDGESTPVSPVPAASGDYPKAVDGALRQHSAPVGKRGGKRCRQKPKGGPERQGKRTEDRFGLKSICLCDCHFLAVINAS